MDSLVRLPPAAFPLPPTAPSPPVDDAPPVDTFSSVAFDLLTGLYTSLDPSRAQALVALALHAGVDPAAIMDASPPGRTGGLPLVSFLLSNLPWGERGTNLRWPDTLDGFGPGLLEAGASVDGEWLVALLLAAGAHVWPPGASPGDCLPIHYAFREGRTGLVRAMLAQPGAHALADLVLPPPPSDLGISSPSLLHWATSEPHMLECLRWMLEQGVRPAPGASPHPLESATPQALALYAQFDALPTAPALCRRLESAWRASAKARNLNAKQVSAMCAQLRGQASTPDQVLAEQLRLDLSTPPWGRASYGVFSPNLGAAAMVSRAAVPTGPLAGTWSGLAARLVSRLRQGSSFHPGMPEFELDAMLGSKGLAPADAPGQNAAGLSGAVGFDWRPGLPIDGPVSLMLLGREPDARDASSCARHLRINATLLGVSDPLAWASTHAPAAVAFTQAIVTRASAAAAGVMMNVWLQALAVHPDYLGRDTASKMGLVAALHAGFRHNSLGSSRWEGLLCALTPWTLKVPPRLAELDAPDRALAVEFALAMDDDRWTQALAHAAGHLDEGNRQRCRLWAAEHQAQSTDAARVATLRSILMDATLQPVPDTRPATRPRM